MNIKNKVRIMQKSGHMLALILLELQKQTKPGITTAHLNEIAMELTKKAGMKPGFLGFNNFPAAICASVNSGMVHGLPNKNPLQSGDLLKIDFGLLYKEYYTDSAITVAVGVISSQAQLLMDTTRKSLKEGLLQVKPGNTIGDIGYTIEKFAKEKKFSIVRTLCGHGIGKKLHDNPQIPNFGTRGEGETLKEGMTIAIEPMLTAGSETVQLGADGSVYETIDGSLTAHFEHTVVVTKNGFKILTKL